MTSHLLKEPHSGICRVLPVNQNGDRPTHLRVSFAQHEVFQRACPSQLEGPYLRRRRACVPARVRLAGVSFNGSCSANTAAKHESQWIDSGHECESPEPTPQLIKTLLLTACTAEASLTVSVPAFSIQCSRILVCCSQYSAMPQA